MLVDDSPVNLARAREEGIVAATIVHPWNAELVERDGVIGARDWRELQAPARAGPEPRVEPSIRRLRGGTFASKEEAN